MKTQDFLVLNQSFWTNRRTRKLKALAGKMAPLYLIALWSSMLRQGKNINTMREGEWRNLIASYEFDVPADFMTNVVLAGFLHKAASGNLTWRPELAPGINAQPAAKKAEVRHV
jgi:hypothetical protein